MKAVLSDGMLVWTSLVLPWSWQVSMSIQIELRPRTIETCVRRMSNVILFPTTNHDHD